MGRVRELHHVSDTYGSRSTARVDTREKDVNDILVALGFDPLLFTVKLARETLHVEVIYGVGERNKSLGCKKRVLVCLGDCGSGDLVTG